MGILEEEFGVEFRQILGETCSAVMQKEPGIVCHYTSSNALLSILGGKSLWFTGEFCLNDSSEGFYIRDVIESCLQGRYDDEFNNYIRLTYNDEYVLPDNTKSTLRSEVYFICCFSRNMDSLPMWNYYAKSNNAVGYNICFDCRKLLDKIHLQYANTKIFHVLYDRKKQEDLVGKVLDVVYKYWGGYSNEKRSDLLEHFKYHVEYFKLAFKHPAFSSEEEIRIVVGINSTQFSEKLKNTTDDNQIKLRTIGNVFVPYLDISFNDPEIVKQITLSPLVKEGEALGSMFLPLFKYGYYNTCEVCKSKIPLKY